MKRVGSFLPVLFVIVADLSGLNVYISQRKMMNIRPNQDVLS